MNVSKGKKGKARAGERAAGDCLGQEQGARAENEKARQV